jgi:hypothetical protein
MSAKHTASVKERRFAEAFLKFMGSDAKNVYLVTAVIAWMRQESGSNYIGNNVFNLRPGKDDAKFRSGVRKSKNGNGYFSVYPSLEAAAKATANRLISAGHDYRGYDKIVAAVRRASDGSAKDQQEQGLDFLTAVAMSKWDASHYGSPNGDAWSNHLVAVWATITGLPALPAEKVKQPKPRPSAPRDLNTNLLPGQFIDPYEIRRFYADKHGSEPPLTGGL